MVLPGQNMTIEGFGKNMIIVISASLVSPILMWIMQEVLYLTDTGRRWNGRECNYS